MALISNEGSVGLANTTLYECRTQNVCAINYTRFSNVASAYSLTLKKYDASTSTTTDIYTLSLSMGDTVTDDMVYILHKGDKLIASTSNASTKFIISGEEGPNLSFLRCK
jgi:hypothetical protein